MFVIRSSYKNFRNIKSAEITFSPGVNILFGGNAEGKTSALEGLYLCSSGRSHRTVHESELINAESSFGMTETVFYDGKRERSIEMCFLPGGKKSCVVSGMAVRKMSEFVGVFKAIIFCPEHLSIVKDGPSCRRSFIDSAVIKNDKEYLSALQGYVKALSQRNNILTDMMYGKNDYAGMLPLWSEKLCEFAAIISEKREKYIRLLDDMTKVIMNDMTGGKEEPSLSYSGGYSKEELMKKLEGSKEREIRAGTTLFGIHKDDIEIKLGGDSARIYASQGQQRSIALAMKLSEGEICRKIYGEYPVYLLDDILSELDKSRRGYLMSGFTKESGSKQVIITTTDENELKKETNGKLIRAEKGQYFEV